MQSAPARLDDLGPDGLELILALAPADRGDALAAAVEDFLDRIGGRENAERAIAMLRELETAGL